MAKKIHWGTLLVGVIVGAAGLYMLQNAGNLGVFIDRVNPNEAFITDGGGHTFGG